MAISGFFGRSNLVRVEVLIEFPREIYANHPVTCRVTLRNNRKMLPVFLLRVYVQENEILFPYVETQSVSTRHLTFTFAQRGVRVIPKIFASSVFPFTFFVRSKALHEGPKVIVFPEPKKCRTLNHFEKIGLSRGEQSSDKMGYDGEILSVRHYLPGDPLKYINWKATARTGDLKTKEMSSLSYQPVIIDFDEIEIRDLEERISCVTHAFIQLVKRNAPVGLKINGKVYQPGTSSTHKIAVLRELALYGIPQQS